MKKHIASALMLLTISQVQAANPKFTVKTEPVKGQAPELISKSEIFNYSRRGSAPVAGDDLRHYMISTKDTDGDTVTATVQWLRDGQAISGQTSLSYIATAQDVGKDITLKYTLKTPAAITDPSETIYTAQSLGKVQKSDNSEKYSPDPIFRRDIGLKTSAEATTACTAAGGQVVTLAQAQNLYIQSTRAITTGENNNDMCTLWSWPMSGECSGTSDFYWIKEGSTLKTFSLRTGLSSTSNTSAYVMCAWEG